MSSALSTKAALKVLNPSFPSREGKSWFLENQWQYSQRLQGKIRRVFTIFLSLSSDWCRPGANSGPSHQQCFPYKNRSFQQNKFSLIVPGRRFTISLSVGKPATGPSTKTTANEACRTKLEMTGRASNKMEEQNLQQAHNHVNQRACPSCQQLGDKSACLGCKSRESGSANHAGAESQHPRMSHWGQDLNFGCLGVKRTSQCCLEH